MREVLKLMRMLKRKYPPPWKRNHALLYENGQLILQLAINDKFQMVLFDEEDMDKSADVLVEDVERVLASRAG
jgi:hypothetical protein